MTTAIGAGAGLPGEPAAALGVRLLGAALVLAALLRIGLVLAFDVVPTSDLGWYFNRAAELAATGRYAEGGVPTAFWPVGYPAFLAAIFTIAGPSVLAGQIANIFLSLLSIALLYWFALKSFGDERVAGIAALLMALYPNHIGYSAGLYSEPLFTVLLLCTVLVVRPHRGLLCSVAVGVLLGATVLVKAQMLLLGPLLVFALLLRGWTRLDLARAAAGAIVATFAMLLTIAPWALRNLEQLGKPVLVSTNGGVSLLAGNNPSVKFGMSKDYALPDSVMNAIGFSPKNQVRADEQAKDMAWQWIRENPVQFVTLMPWKAWRLWAYDGEAEWIFQAGYGGYAERRIAFRTARILNQIYYVGLIVGGFWGIARLVRFRQPESLVVPLLLGFFTLLSMVFSGQSRYHAPLMPFVIAYAAWNLLSFRKQNTGGRDGER